MVDDGPQLLGYWRSMVRVCESVLGSRDDAEDCASDALAAALADPDLAHVENLEAWLVAIAKRRATDVLRRRARNRVRLLRLAGRCEVSHPDVADRVADESEARWLSRRADEVLTPPARAVLGVVAEGGTIDEAAARLAMSRRSAESHLHRARVLLRAARAAIPAFVVAAFRNGRRPAAATSVALVGAVVLLPAIDRPQGRHAVPEVRLAPAVVGGGDVTPAAARKVAPRTGVRHRPAPARVKPAAPLQRAVHRPVTPPSDPVTPVVEYDKLGVQITEREHDGPEDPVGIVLDCLDQFRVDPQRIGC